MCLTPVERVSRTGYRRRVSVVLAGCVLASISVPRSAVPGTARHAVIVGFSPFGRTAVRRAIDTAIEKLALPGCSEIYSDFELPGGGTPRDRLDRMGLSPQEL